MVEKETVFVSFQEEKAPTTNEVAMEGAKADGVVLVTSATGNIGRYVIRSILQSSSGLKVRATVHDPAKAEFFKQVRNLMNREQTLLSAPLVPWRSLSRG